ncbi:dihydrofolate reductase family protein [Nocardia puris]|uniref:dihydrofolate reductase family protein n=1 Tax=Nocardia puris TaxID=208602 RepID=UPI001894FB55|nr:dihydrofolate reductase family protein [Nocardia puris]MBF6214338.1 dihydrofolate reductase family protein [Nocardia puris]MBF6368953.1 dihydrofolate reductase family protein [Nocardia puris]MBF6462899.1 dihydrofolate reductase family protein [Nocardia puris]
MRDLVVTQNITVDGVIDASEGWFTVEDESVDESDILAELMEQTARSDAILFGRTTFEEMRGYWPEQTDDKTGITDDLNRTTKYVVSSSMTDPGWQNSVILRDLDGVRAVKQQPGRDIVCTGSITLVHHLIEAGLVDEFRLFVYPVVLGHGAKLFTEGAKVPPLRRTATKTFRSGVVLLSYRTD